MRAIRKHNKRISQCEAKAPCFSLASIITSIPFMNSKISSPLVRLPTSSTIIAANPLFHYYSCALPFFTVQNNNHQ
ncbi:hypothetical protein RJT34_26785 [Clitoria ternatea]|uniref:Uncharacterized protein n=1 Tax=Clitoria ternatea TaxID=43366 RepID=A0AAN9F741_CLITE